MPWTPFRSMLSRVLEEHLNGAATPDPAKFYLMLTNASTFTDSSALLAVIMQEHKQENGYTRQNYNPAAGSYDATQTRYEMPQQTVMFSASGGTIQFDRVVLISGASATANRIVTTIDSANNKLAFATATAHGLVAGDRVVVTADAGGTVPPELLNSGAPQILYVINPIDTSTERSIQLALTAGGSVIDFGAGTASIRVRYANGEAEFFDSYTTSTINDGATYNVQIAFNIGGGTADVNAP